MSKRLAKVALLLALGGCLALSAPPAAMATAEELEAIFDQASTAYDKGDYEEARGLYQQAAELSTEIFGPEHPDTLVAQTNLALAYYHLGEYRKTLELQRQVLEARQRLLGPEHPDTLMAQNNLAVICSELGEHRKALELQRQVLEARQHLLGPEHPDTLMAQNNLAVTYSELGEHQKALELKRQVWEARQGLLGPEHPDTLRAKNNLAFTYSDLGEHQKALELQRQVLEARQRLLGPEHLDTLTALNNLAFTCSRLGEYQKALELRRQVLETRQRVQGPEHPDTLTAQTNLAVTYSSLGEYHNALELQRRILEARRRALGPEHPNTLTEQTNLASTYSLLGEYQKALEVERQILETRQRVQGPEHPDALTAQANLAVTYYYLGEHQKALELQRQVWESRRRVQGPGHPRTLTDLNNLALTYSRLGGHQKALELQRQVWESSQRLLGPEHPDSLKAQTNLAATYFVMGEEQKALELYAQAFAGQVQKLGLYHPQAASAAMNMAIILKDLQQLEGAIFYARLAVEAAQRQRWTQKTLERELQASYLATIEGRYQNLAAWLIEAGRPEEALAVLRLLKEDEISEMTRAAAEGAPETTDPLRAGLAELGAALAEADAALEELEKKEAVVGRALEQAETRLVEVRQAFQAYLERLPGLLAQPRESPYQAAAHRNLEKLQALTVSLGSGAVIIHTFSAPDALHLFLTTPEGLVLRQSPVARETLEKKAAALQPLLRSPGLDPRPLAREIHELVIGPLVTDLAGAGTLMFSVDGALRYIPLAALYDGRKWLAEEYALVMFTEAARDKLKPQVSLKVQAAALGLTEAKDGLPPLPAVQGEVDDVVKLRGEKNGVLPGVKFLNEKFNYQALSASLKEGRQVLHLASHFVFRPTEPNQSYLLLGDGSRLTISDINQDGDLPFNKVDLVTLSACDTATGLARGNGREVEGLAAIAQMRGAATVLATLWPIADESTGWLMGDFYRLRYEGKLSKAEALRQAQLNLMRGQGAARDRTSRGQVVAPLVSGLRKEEATPAEPWTGRTYAHPYFWAPFILMGNWK